MINLTPTNELIEVATRRTLSFGQFRAENPNISIGNNANDATLTYLGLARVYITDQPSGDIVTQTEPMQAEDGRWFRDWEVRDFTPEEIEEIEASQPPPPPSFTYKTDVWWRMTDDEVDQLNGALKSAGPREYNMWRDCLTLEHHDDYFRMLTEQFTLVFGAERTAELLAPSNGG